jgi:hypothetical protein
MTTSSNSDQRRPSQESVDVSILREVARTSLVHALNSVSSFLPLPAVAAYRMQGERREDSRAGPFLGRTT